LAPGALAQVLRPLLDLTSDNNLDSRLVVGLEQPDDAVVYRLNGDLHLVVSVDFFGPVVDDAYTYGAIAAANAISDIYAMGGDPFLALNLAAFPADMPPQVASAILRGGADKARQAGVIVAGGHTMDDKEPKYGLVTLGTLVPERILLKGGARAGERLVLTKPLGSGIITTCIKAGLVPPDVMTEVTNWMLRLNRDAIAAVHATHARGATDITGFGFLGHTVEMARESGVRFCVRADHIPLLDAARQFAEEWLFPGGAVSNEQYFGQWVTFASDVPEEMQMLLFDPQTNGGILASIPSEEMDVFVARCRELQQPYWEIGEVVEGEPGVEIV
jgi:selenide,water dikinase